jgi:hypothetical protein
LAEFAGIPATPLVVAALLGLLLRRCGAGAPVPRQSAAATS